MARDAWVVTAEWDDRRPIPAIAFRRRESAVRFLERDEGAVKVGDTPEKWRHGELTYRVWYTELRR